MCDRTAVMAGVANHPPAELGYCASLPETHLILPTRITISLAELGALV